MRRLLAWHHFSAVELLAIWFVYQNSVELIKAQPNSDLKVMDLDFEYRFFHRQQIRFVSKGPCHFKDGFKIGQIGIIFEIFDCGQRQTTLDSEFFRLSIFQ